MMHILSHLGPDLNKYSLSFFKIHKEAIQKQLGFYSWYSKLTDKQFERGCAVEKWKTIVW